MPQRTLQKSFSEQDHSGNTKHRHQWQRNKTYQGQSSERGHGGPKGAGEKPPLAVSTSTKNKLSSFVHKPAHKDSQKHEIVYIISSSPEDKENVAPPLLQQTHRSVEEKAENQPRPPSMVEKSKPVPSTPGDKLALPDLTTMADMKRARESVSPEERLLWDVEGSSISALKDLPRGKKRARSSSPIPTVSPQVRTGPDFDIWRSHSLKGSDFEHIMQSSSPQHTKEGHTPRTMARLKRTQSLGNNHYIPSNKRIKRSSPEKDESQANKAQRSKLSTFIENLRKDLTQSAQPTPNRALMEVKSPSQKVFSSQRPSVEKTIDEPVKGSDYGSDDDFDLLGESILNIFESTQETPLARIGQSPRRKPPFKPPGDATNATTPVTVLAEKTSEVGISKIDEDEFDDGMDDADFDEALVETSFTAEQDQVVSAKTKSPSKQQQIGGVSGAVCDDEFGDDLDITDFEAAEAAATQSLHGARSSLLPVQAIQRYLVTHVLDSEFDGPYGRMQKEKLLLVQNEDTKMNKTVHLRGTWIETPATVKAYVHIIGSFEKDGRCIVDDVNNMIILHPDHLLSSTVVADSFGCTRRAVLQDRVKATSEANKSLVYGTILHELFQTAMLHNSWDTQFLHQLLEEITKRHMEDLYTINITLPDALEHLQSKLGELQSWAELFVTSKPNSQAIVQAGNGDKAAMCVSKLLDVEEHVWSPMYGLKGNIDATVQVTMKDGKHLRTLTVPFEVKTGKTASAAHRAQTALYNLLLSDRYDVDIAYGILYYMETSETIRIPAIRHELRHMIMQRNELACFVRERHAQLPPMLKKENMCGRCYAKVPCFIYHRLADDGNAETSGMKQKFDEVVKHLTPRHKEFFLNWDDLLTKEEKESLKFRRELWTMLSSEREKLGRCFSNVIIEPASAVEEKENPKINRYQYTMVKQNPPPKFSFLESQITIGEPIVISDEKGHFALANGYVISVRKKRITVAVDRRLHNARIRQPGFDMVDNQVFASIMEVAGEGSSPDDAKGKIQEPPIMYRLDKDEFSNGMATVRNNLIQIMAEGPFGSREIRNLVVDLKQPRFKPHSTQYVLKDRASLNIDQRRAIEKVMSAQDYALVLGMPGTGKTTTIAHIIRALVSQGKSVLLTSYTHTAVDNILLKLKDDTIPILRLGTVAKINAEVQEFSKLAATSRTSFEEIQEDWLKTPIVATTCLGINHPLFNERTFDYCIVDEASQITLPVCLGPIRMAKTFILVGDHNQLPPLVQNEAARIGGLDISLFKYLSDAHPNSVVYLEHQYRMCADIMALSNALIYDGRLKCGSTEVANRSLHIPNMDALRTHHHTPSTLARFASSSTQVTKTICPSMSNASCWLHHLLTTSTTIRFLNTDTLLPQSREVSRGARLINPLEATLCTQLVLSLLSVGVPASSIGVMTHYRSQLALLKDSLRMHPEVEMHTADRFQGRDKDVVVLSLVRSNSEGKIGELLRDWRRVNVAFTRAKCKLIVIGSRGTLLGCVNGRKRESVMEGIEEQGNEEMVARFVRFMEGKGWIYDLPAGAQDMHCFEETATQTQLSAVSHTVAGVWTATQGAMFKDIEGTAFKLGGKGATVGTERPVLEEQEGKENKGGAGRHEPKRIRGGKTIATARQGTVFGDILNDLG